jgi:hypothetical protein
LQVFAILSTLGQPKGLPQDEFVPDTNFQLRDYAFLEMLLRQLRNSVQPYRDTLEDLP